MAIETIISTHRSPVIVKGAIRYGFTTNGEWPNEHGEKPEDLIGRACKYDDRLFKVITCEQVGPGIHHFECEPL